jgi:RNA polymerase sigma factor (sigma-70 family)
MADFALAEQYLPVYDVSDAIATVADADHEAAWRALLDVDLLTLGRKAPMVGMLGALRMLPEIIGHLLHGERPAEPPESMRLRDLPSIPMYEGGWILLGERPGEEIALGLVRKFWRPVIEWARITSADEFRDFDEPGFAKTVYDLSVREVERRWASWRKMSEHRVSGPMDLAAAFERERSYLRTVALRMLGSGEAANDAVQEAWLRLNRAGGDGIEDLRAWLTTVTSRVCLDMLRTRRTRREVPVEIDLDELLPGAARIGAEDRTPTPEDEVLLAESVGLALHIVMDSLTPAERVAFVLHDIFDLPFGQIATVLGRSPDAVKMLASRARRRVRVVPPQASAGEADDRAVVDASFTAAGSGDLSGLLALLAPDAELRSVNPERVTVVQGAADIAAQAGAARAGAAAGAVLRPITVRGAAGVLILVNDRPARYWRSPSETDASPKSGRSPTRTG